jgi:hypothetical protein
MHFLGGECLPQDGKERPKHVRHLPHVVIVSNYSAVVGTYMVTYLTAQNVDNFKLSEDYFQQCFQALKRY